MKWLEYIAALLKLLCIPNNAVVFYVYELWYRIAKDNGNTSQKMVQMSTL